VNGEPIPGCEVKNVFGLLGSQEVFPIVSVCPPEVQMSVTDISKDKKAATAKPEGSEDPAADGTEAAEAEGAATLKTTGKEKNFQMETWQLFELADILDIDPHALDNMPSSQKSQLYNKWQEETKKLTVPFVMLVRKGAVETAPVDEQAEVQPSGEDIEEERDASATKLGTSDELEPIDKVFWMYETDTGWILFTKEESRAMEDLKRKGRHEYILRSRPDGIWKVQLTLSNEGPSKDQVMKQDNSDTVIKVRRHVKGDGLAGKLTVAQQCSFVSRFYLSRALLCTSTGEWEMFSNRFAPPITMNGLEALNQFSQVGRSIPSASTIRLRASYAAASCFRAVLQVWDRGEDMQGSISAKGFLFLYNLLQGHIKVKVVSSGYGGFGSYGSYGGAYGGAYGESGQGSSSNDSYRYGLLMAQLYKDVRIKSVWGSVINLLCHNRQVRTVFGFKC
jgi:hypothetical protein